MRRLARTILLSTRVPWLDRETGLVLALGWAVALFTTLS